MYEKCIKKRGYVTSPIYFKFDYPLNLRNYSSELERRYPTPRLVKMILGLAGSDSSF
jgi:hypothetical protein